MSSPRRDGASGAKTERIAVDAGVWLDGLLFGGPGEDIVKMALGGRVRLLTSESVIADVSLVLRRRFAFSDAALRLLARFLRESCEVVDDAPAARNGDRCVAAGAPVSASTVRLAASGGADTVALIRRRAVVALAASEVVGRDVGGA